ncbi:DUF4129 domain-containing protein [Streptomyces sp. H10-C2]|uniref:DUF4129 domain-containing protein n=1 Tax=unclassified Streptomyces TaxID=2593676 RepID=UPI0024BA51C8|nr:MULTISPECIES: DUF4129 domain-containing protein [unclassified Streptomyces]MDJ0345740.1 DUF4129 domain-containing protein [Streptomyces sp. PH10-H1]MDJ0374567.1 DUF4129 domain-containing protein [Streptomyces sp. H10-C2]
MSGDAPVTTPRDAAREAAEHELSKGIYHQNDPSLFQRALDWLWGKVGDLLSAASGATPGGGVGLLVIALIVVLLAAALRWRLGRIRQTSTDGPGLFGDHTRTAAEHRAAAERHAAARRWTEASQERMRALVRSLEERTVLDPRPGRTADEAAADAGRALPDHAAALRDAARLFDDLTYGGRTGTEPAYTGLRDLDTQLLRAKPQFAAGGART